MKVNRSESNVFSLQEACVDRYCDSNVMTTLFIHGLSLDSSSVRFRIGIIPVVVNRFGFSMHVANLVVRFNVFDKVVLSCWSVLFNDSWVVHDVGSCVVGGWHVWRLVVGMHVLDGRNDFFHEFFVLIVGSAIFGCICDFPVTVMVSNVVMDSFSMIQFSVMSSLIGVHDLPVVVACVFIIREPSNRIKGMINMNLRTMVNVTIIWVLVLHHDLFVSHSLSMMMSVLSVAWCVLLITSVEV